MNILFFLLIFFLLGFVIFYIISFFTGAPFIPASARIVREMMDLAEIKNGMHIVDLGSGDGRILIACAKKGAYGIGYEINPFLVLWSRLRSKMEGVDDRVTVYWKSLYSADLTQVDVIMLYGITEHMPHIEKKILQSRPGTTIISYRFRFPHLSADLSSSSKIYRYTR